MLLPLVPPLAVTFPKGSYVYSVCTVPEASAKATRAPQCVGEIIPNAPAVRSRELFVNPQPRQEVGGWRAAREFLHGRQLIVKNLRRGACDCLAATTTRAVVAKGGVHGLCQRGEFVPRIPGVAARAVASQIAVAVVGE